MPVQLTLRSPKGGRVLHEQTYDDGHRIEADSGFLIIRDRNGSAIAAHTACPGLEGAVVEYASAALADAPEGGTFPGLPHGDESANPDGVARGEEPVPTEEDLQSAARAGLVREVARLRASLASAEAARDANRDDAERRGRLLDAQQETTEDLRDQVGRERAHVAELEATVALYRHRYGSRLNWTGGQLDTPADEAEDPLLPETRRREEGAGPHPIDQDPRRPSLDHYPLDAILLTYPEVRRLLGLHLETCAGDPALARAMYEGEAPLRLAEVLS